MSEAMLRPIAQGLFDAVAEIGFCGARLREHLTEIFVDAISSHSSTVE
jgi:hypothetical protein